MRMCKRSAVLPDGWYRTKSWRRKHFGCCDTDDAMSDAAAGSAASETAPLLEAVPNVSEGRRRDVLDRLSASAGGAGAQLLHVTSDPDHNRSVFTLAGAAAPLSTALLALFETAVAEIDLRRQRGVHPRVGAVDVVP